jgi:hypothetical protein
MTIEQFESIFDSLRYEDRRDVIVQVLGALMSELSEDHYCAGWMMGLEEDLPRLCRDVLSGTPRTYGMHEITREKAETLTYLAGKAGSWATLGNGYLYEPYSPQDHP